MTSESDGHYPTECTHGAYVVEDCAQCALDCIGNIISDAPYQGEERDGAWQAFLENQKVIDAALTANVSAVTRSDSVVTEGVTAGETALDDSDPRQRCAWCGASNSKSCSCWARTIVRGEKPPYSAQECQHGHLGGCLACESERQECAEEVIYAAVNFLRGYVWDGETEKLAVALERVALEIEEGKRQISRACDRYRELAGPFPRGRCDKCGLSESFHNRLAP